MVGDEINQSDVEDARRYLHQMRARLTNGTAVSSDHRPALEAMLLLPEQEACCWFQEFTQRFAALRREQERSGGVRSSQPAMTLARTQR